MAPSRGREYLIVKTFGWGVIGFNYDRTEYHVIDLWNPTRFREVLKTVAAWDRYSRMSQEDYETYYVCPPIEEWGPKV